MALYSLIFQKPVRPSFEIPVLGVPQVIEFDAAISENHQRTADITQNAIETGSNIADHINLKPKKLTLNAIISDAPLSFLGSAIGAGLSGASQLANNAAGKGSYGNIAATATGIAGGTLAGLITGSPKDPKDSWKVLEDIWKRRIPFTVITALQRYESMAIQDLTAPRSASVGKSLEFTVVLEEVIIVKSAVVKVANFSLSSDAGSADSSNSLGKQSTKQANSSILFRGLGLGG